MDVLRRGLKPSDVITRKSLENAIAGVAMSGGSTNAVLHLLALAREAGVDLTIDDFDRISEATPLLCDLQPGGQYVAVDLYAAGGVPLVIQRMREAGVLHEDAITVTGHTVGEHAAQATETDGQQRRAAARATRSSPAAAWRSCAATSRRRAASSSSSATSAATTAGRRASSRARRRRWTPSPTAASRPATS